MRVMSYNVNGFKGNKDSLINMRENLDKIEAFIKGFLFGDIDNLVILQEVPLKDNAICYKKIIEKFKDYKFICSNNVSVANFVTVAIANKKSNWIKQDDFLNQKIEYKYAENTDKTDYNNRFVELYNKDYSLKILGLHIPLKKKDNVESVDQFWGILKNYKNKCYENKTVDCNVAAPVCGTARHWSAEHFCKPWRNGLCGRESFRISEYLGEGERFY